MIRLSILLFICLLCSKIFGQKSGELYQTISKLDSIFFEAFNNCDLKIYESFLTFDYEFYHDKQGLTVLRKNEINSMTVFCGEQRNRQQIRRELIKESLEIYPLNQYGAIENGEHVFYLVIDEKTSKPISKAKFTSIWRFDNDEWKLARTISYNHTPYGYLQLDEEVLKLYEGNYQASDRIVNIKNEGTNLVMTDLVDNKEVWSAELLAETEDTFYLNQNNVQFKFIKRKGIIKKMVVYENGIQIEELKKKQ